ncbi:MAG: S8 family serine peptidase [Acidimicrobiia bacterium]|nr:S8 family serine peptidase [Acidimicrobiia bacterium]
MYRTRRYPSLGIDKSVPQESSVKLKSNVILTALAVVVAALLPVPLTTGALQETTSSGDDSRVSYIVLQDAEPVLEYDGGVEGVDATATENGTRPDPRSDAVKEYRGHLKEVQNKAVSSVGVDPKQILNRYHYTLVGFSALLTEAEAAELRRHDGVLAVQQDVLYELTSQEEPDEGPTTTTAGNRETAGPAGDGVVVGVIDTGIWPEHPSFADNGNLEEVPETWRSNACAFGASDYNPDDTDFECNNKLIGARNLRATYTDLLGAEIYGSARDYTGHGTQTAAIAAGNRSVPTTVLDEELGPISGVAPRAHIAAYSACGSLGCYASDVTAAVDRAVADGVDVINYSIVGGAAPTSAVGLALLKAVSVGVSVATAAGNDGPGANTVGSPGTEPWVTTVAANTQGRSFAAAVTVDGERFVGASVAAGAEELRVVDGADRGNPRCDPSIDFEPSLEGEIVLCSRGAVQLTAKSRAISEQGGGGMILFNQSKSQALVTDSHSIPTINVDFETGTAIKKLIASAEGGVSASIERLGPRPDSEPSVPTFSSRGPNAVEGGILKPDVSAPGSNVLTATTPTPIAGQSEELFQTVSGTSMSSAHVVGLMALLIETHPDWSPAAVKSALMTTSDQTKGSDSPFAGGAGAVALDHDETDGSTPFEPSVVFDVDPADYMGYLCETAAWVVTGDTCAEGGGDGLITPSDLNQPSIAIERVTAPTSVTRTVTNVSNETLRLSVEIATPEGVDVEVSPTDISLPAGESATFEVTVTVEDGAETDTWSNGSITWVRGDGQDGEAVAHIPVMIQPVALESPATVTGEDGVATADISFGYDGAFDVTTFGLAAPTTTSDTVGQDETPEGTSPRFRRSDRRHGGATAHEIEVTDAAHLRLSLNKGDLTLPEGISEHEVDLDLYLYDSEGKQVARSTVAGTDEMIDISFPKDDTYTLYVHGWAVGDEEMEYALRGWVVPAETDGSLEIAEAPTSASTGDDATIQLEWDADDIDNGLGVVVYEGPDGRLGVTLVETP